MLCCVIPLLLMVAMRRLLATAGPMLGFAQAPSRSMPPAARRTVGAVDTVFVGVAR